MASNPCHGFTRLGSSASCIFDTHSLLVRYAFKACRKFASVTVYINIRNTVPALLYDMSSNMAPIWAEVFTDPEIGCVGF